jgi:hypothetical protein
LICIEVYRPEEISKLQTPTVMKKPEEIKEDHRPVTRRSSVQLSDSLGYEIPLLAADSPQ